MVYHLIGACVAIGSLTYLGIEAMMRGIDGTLLMLIVCCVSGLAGYNAKGVLDSLRRNSGTGGK